MLYQSDSTQTRIDLTKFLNWAQTSVNMLQTKLGFKFKAKPNSRRAQTLSLWPIYLCWATIPKDFAQLICIHA